VEDPFSLNRAALRDWLKAMLEADFHEDADALFNKKLDGRGFKSVTKQELKDDYGLYPGAAASIVAMRDQFLKGVSFISFCVCGDVDLFLFSSLCVNALVCCRSPHVEHPLFVDVFLWPLLWVVSALPCLLLYSAPCCLLLLMVLLRRCCHNPNGLVSHMLYASVDVLTCTTRSIRRS
jgi:hypothetical protein